MKAKIIVGIIIGVIIVIGLGYGFSNTENGSSIDQQVITEDVQVAEPVDDNKGNQFTIELSDSVTTTGP